MTSALGGLGEPLLLKIAAKRGLPDRTHPKRMRLDDLEQLETVVRDAWDTARQPSGTQVGFKTMQAGRAGLDGELTAESAAIIFRVAGWWRRRGVRSRYLQHRVIDWWLQRCCPVLLIDAALEVAGQLGREGVPPSSVRQAPLFHLRARLSCLNEAEWRIAHAHAAERIDGGCSPAQLLTLAAVFPQTTTWTDRAFAAWDGFTRWGWVHTPPDHVLLACARNGAQIRHAAPKRARQSAECFDIAAWTVVYRLGAAAAPAMLAINPGAEFHAALDPDPAYRAPAYEMALMTVPTQAVPALVRLPADARAIAATVLAGALEDPSKTLQKAVAKLDASTREALGVCEPKSEPAPVDDVPLILRPDALDALDAEPAAVEAQAPVCEMRWDADERAEWQVLDSRPPPADPDAFVRAVLRRLGLPPVVARLTEIDDPQALRSLAMAHRARGVSIRLDEFEHLPRRLAVHLWNTLPPVSMVGANAKGLTWWLATVELEALPGLLRFIDEMPESGFAAAAPFAVTAIAESAIEHLDGSVARSTAALDWIRRHSDVAIDLLMPRTSGPTSPERTAARHTMDILAAAGLLDVIRERAKLWGAVGERVCDGLANGWFIIGRPTKIQKAPRWWRFLDTRPALPNATALPDTAFEVLRGYLSLGTVNAPHMRVPEIYAQLEPASIGPFLIAVLTAWDTAGRRAAHAWVLSAVSAWPDPSVADALGAYVLEWARKRRASAEMGIGALARLGTRRAVQHLGIIRDRWPRARAGLSAARRLRHIARLNGWNRHQLADRTQRTGPFNTAGVARFDFGPRWFELSLNDQLGAQLIDSAGKIWSSLPSLRKSDDPVRGPIARNALQRGQQAVPSIKLQTIRRLRRLLEAGGIWALDDFERFVEKHPVVGRVAPGLVFGVFRGDECTAAGCLQGHGLCDLDGAPLALNDADRIGVAHPYDLGAERVAAFMALLAQLGRQPILPQLSRSTPGLTAEEADMMALPRFADRKIPALQLNTLIGQGVWFGYDPSEDRFRRVARALPGGGWAILDLDFGPLIPRWGVDNDSTHTLNAIRLQSAGTFGDLHPRVVCEILNDLNMLVGDV